MNPLVLMAGVKTAAHFIDRVISRPQTSRTQRASNSHSDFARLLMERLDGDHDGVITRKEAGIETSLFEKLDTNADGVLDSGELEKGAHRMKRSLIHNRNASERFALLDSNRDGVLSLTESGKRQAEFQQVDRNRNERLEPREWARAHRTH